MGNYNENVSRPADSDPSVGQRVGGSCWCKVVELDWYMLYLDKYQLGEVHLKAVQAFAPHAIRNYQHFRWRVAGDLQ